MEEIIERFNKVMEAYNEAYTNASNIKEREEVDKKFEIIISEAEKLKEDEMEDFIKSEDNRLENEHKTSEEALKKLEDIKEDIVKPLVQFPQVELREILYNKFIIFYKKSYTLKRLSTSFKESELILILSYLGVKSTSKGTKSEKVKMIIEKIIVNE